MRFECTITARAYVLSVVGRNCETIAKVAGGDEGLKQKILTVCQQVEPIAQHLEYDRCSVQGVVWKDDVVEVTFKTVDGVEAFKAMSEVVDCLQDGAFDAVDAIVQNADGREYDVVFDDISFSARGNWDNYWT